MFGNIRQQIIIDGRNVVDSQDLSIFAMEPLIQYLSFDTQIIVDGRDVVDSQDLSIFAMEPLIQYLSFDTRSS